MVTTLKIQVAAGDFEYIGDAPLAAIVPLAERFFDALATSHDAVERLAAERQKLQAAVAAAAATT
jgi:hypothetical protein